MSEKLEKLKHEQYVAEKKIRYNKLRKFPPKRMQSSVDS